MHTSLTMKFLLGALALGAVNLGFAAEEKEEIVPFDQVPATVQKTIQAQVKANEAELGEVEKETEDTKVTYEATLTLPNDRKLEVEVAEDGSLIKVEGADDDGKKDEDNDEDEDEKKEDTH